MEIKENSKLLDRKHFLMRAVECKNKTHSEVEEEIAAIDKQVAINLKEALQIESDRLKTEVATLKVEIKTDGDFKRGVAYAIIKILESEMPKEELKGVFRQGYKIMRTRC